MPRRGTWSVKKMVSNLLSISVLQDVAVKLGCGHPMGPFELFDYIGHDTMDLIMRGWGGRYPEETLFRRSETVRTLVEEGKLGRKTGEGFYKY